jgi:hypothetical protein
MFEKPELDNPLAKDNDSFRLMRIDVFIARLFSAMRRTRSRRYTHSKLPGSMRETTKRN